MEKIIVDFNEVRGLGNVVSPKSLSDFERISCDIVSDSGTVAGAFHTVYRMVYSDNTLLLSVSGEYVKSGGTLNVTVSLTDENGDPVSGASVELFKEVN